MRVLVVLSEPPLVEGGAVGRCAAGMLAGLAAHGLEVHALAARWPYHPRDEPPAALAEAGVTVEVVDLPDAPIPRFPKVHQLRRPLDELVRVGFADRVRAAALHADVVHVEAVEAAWCGEALRRPTVWHLHYRSHLDVPLGPPWRQDARRALAQRLLERRVLGQARYLLASSPRVAATLRRARPLVPLATAPLSLLPDVYPRAPLDGPPEVGILGTAAWAPTAQAMRRLVTGVWPRVRAALPEARLRVAGRGVEALGLSGPGVDVVGEVPSAPAFLAGLSALVYPVERGSGMKVKVLESLACGLPVVTTRWGAEGVDAPGGVVVAATDEALAEATVGLLSDPQARSRAGSAARAAFDRFYAPAPATALLPTLYRRMAGPP